jgi:molybdate transport system permease protein
VDTEPLVLSFQVATLATIIAAVMGIALAALLANVRFPGRDLVDVVLTAPIVLPPTVLGYYLLVALGHRSWIGHAWEVVVGSRIVFTRTGIVVAATVGSLPIVIKSGRAALEDVDRTLVRAARTLGAGATRAFFTVQLPLAARGIMAALMFAFARSLGDFGATYMLGGSIEHETRTAALAIFDDINAHREHEAAVMAAVLGAIAIVILWVANTLTARARDGR